MRNHSRNSGPTQDSESNSTIHMYVIVYVCVVLDCLVRAGDIPVETSWRAIVSSILACPGDPSVTSRDSRASKHGKRKEPVRPVKTCASEPRDGEARQMNSASFFSLRNSRSSCFDWFDRRGRKGERARDRERERARGREREREREGGREGGREGERERERERERKREGRRRDRERRRRERRRRERREERERERERQHPFPGNRCGRRRALGSPLQRRGVQPVSPSAQKDPAANRSSSPRNGRVQSVDTTKERR